MRWRLLIGLGLLAVGCGSSAPQQQAAPPAPSHLDRMLAETQRTAPCQQAPRPPPRPRTGDLLKWCEQQGPCEGREAAMVCALAACNVRAVVKARKYIDWLTSLSRKRMARQTCAKNGVVVPID